MTEGTHVGGAILTDERLGRLVDAGVVLAALALGRYSRRLRWLGMVTGTFLAASAFTGWTPTEELVRAIRAKREEPEAESELEPDFQPEITDALARSEHGVPRRVPREIEAHAHAAANGHGDEPAPSVDGDLGISD